MTERLDDCPFGPCGEMPQVLPYQPHPLIEPHMMFNFMNGSPNGTPCPASLMRWPLTSTARKVLQEQEEVWRPHVEAYDDPSHPAWREMKGPNVEKSPLPESQPLRQPGRIGREPNPRSSAWALGGRQDEDVISSGEEKRGVIPPYADAYGMGRSMISELAGYINAAGAAGAEARNALDQAIEALGRARGAIAQAVGEASSESLNDYLAFLGRAITECQDAQAQIDAGQDKGQEFIGRLSM